LYYDKIDYTIIEKSWKAIQGFIKLPYIIHIVGTNGKGTTGRYLASLLNQAKKSVLHYSSPHIIKFNERIWIDGEDAKDQELDEAHQFLQNNLLKEYLTKLTYFEYTTLLALVLSSKKEYLVLEAGLGGEFDATNVVKNDLSVFTPIGYDHQSFLGDTLQEIATTKMKSCDRRFILSPQKYEEVYEIKNKILFDKEEITLEQIESNIEINHLPEFLQNNFLVALNIIKFLEIELNTYQLPELKGRFEYYKRNIILDVGHNLLAAQSIAREFNKLQQKFTLIYNCYVDKDYTNILKLLQPYIEQIQIIPCFDKRIISKEILEDSIKSLEIPLGRFNIEGIKENKTYLVFGSFSVVEQFLKGYKEV
jgi:dihydrofolate synthase / folylpolyglutamate synthase